jgi:hypothetical protein
MNYLCTSKAQARSPDDGYVVSPLKIAACARAVEKPDFAAVLNSFVNVGFHSSGHAGITVTVDKVCGPSVFAVPGYARQCR